MQQHMMVSIKCKALELVGTTAFEKQRTTFFPRSHSKCTTCSHQVSEPLCDIFFVDPDADEAHMVAIACSVRGRLDVHEFQIRRQPNSR